MSSELSIKIENVSKEYYLGAIGGTTLREEMHRLADRLFRRENYTPESERKFMALQDINLEVRKGERVGIIGHNGAGKSTLLKLLARVTGPTTGTISYNGRISSMLEVGTGFHGELTGRENIYMNGAILGMRKWEIDKKLDSIIEFAEMAKFIDTPVKRYSSGMYVKLAFAVAAHLDNEILIMDEVLAVGDMKFQQKCLGKMGDASAREGKTVLYVSHNMNTIRQLCQRCVVLDHGKVAFDGDVERAIEIYSGIQKDIELEKDLAHAVDYVNLASSVCMRFLKSRMTCEAEEGDKQELKIDLTWEPLMDKVENLYFRLEFWHGGAPVATAFSANSIDVFKGKASLRVDVGQLAPQDYILLLRVFRRVKDMTEDIFGCKLQDFSKTRLFEDCHSWPAQDWGGIKMADMSVEE